MGFVRNAMALIWPGETNRFRRGSGYCGCTINWRAWHSINLKDFPYWWGGSGNRHYPRFTQGRRNFEARVPKGEAVISEVEGTVVDIKRQVMKSML